MRGILNSLHPLLLRTLGQAIAVPFCKCLQPGARGPRRHTPACSLRQQTDAISDSQRFLKLRMDRITNQFGGLSKLSSQLQDNQAPATSLAPAFPDIPPEPPEPPRGPACPEHVLHLAAGHQQAPEQPVRFAGGFVGTTNWHGISKTLWSNPCWGLHVI